MSHFTPATNTMAAIRTALNITEGEQNTRFKVDEITFTAHKVLEFHAALTGSTYEAPAELVDAIKSKDIIPATSHVVNRALSDGFTAAHNYAGRPELSQTITSFAIMTPSDVLTSGRFD